MIIPYRVDVPSDRWPVVNWLILVAVIAVFGLQVAEQQAIERQMEAIEQQLEEEVARRVAEGESAETATERVRDSLIEKTLYRFALDGWDISGLFGHMWLHGGIFHLIGNVIFLWVFGNAVCSKVGNIFHLPIYVGLGLIAAISHLIFVGGRAIGASGAINGIVGMYLVFFPENAISCLWLFWFPLMIRPFARTFTVRSFWMILLWFLFDLYGLIRGGQGVAYLAHIGGLLGGIGLGVLMLKLKWVTMESYEKSILQLIGLEKTEANEDVRRDFAGWQQQYLDDDVATSEPKTKTIQGQAPAAAPEAIAQGPETAKQEPIRFRCSCGRSIRAPAKYRGKIAACPSCKRNIKIPQQSDLEHKDVPVPPQQDRDRLIRFVCRCGKRIKVPREHAGRIGRCPNCSARVKVPER